MPCPTYGIRVVNNEGGENKWLTQSEIEQQCKHVTSFSCPAGDTLFPNGECHRCPSEYPHLKEGEGDVWCENDASERWVNNFINPYNCEGPNIIASTLKNRHRPCYPENAFEVTVPGYYTGQDLNNELTMVECSKLLNVNGETFVNQNNIEKTHQFSVIREADSWDEHGFIHCPRKEDRYSFAGAGWVFIYCSYATGGIILLLFYLYKKGKENQGKKIKVDGVIMETREASVTSDSESFGGGYHSNSTIQTGYAFDWFGKIAWVALWIMSWGIQLFLLFITLDVYGLHKDTFCGAEVREACRDAEYIWRSGYGCSYGCLFGTQWTSGLYSTWPYEQKLYGVENYIGITIFMFPFMMVWWFALILLYKDLSTFFLIKCNLDVADYVLCSQLKEKDIKIDGDSEGIVGSILQYFEQLTSKLFKHDFVNEKCKVVKEQNGNKYFIFRCIKYSWSSDGAFSFRNINVATTKREYVQLGMTGLTSEEAESRIKAVGENRINYDIPTLSQSVWDEFFSGFYLYQLGYTWLWHIAFYFLMGLLLDVVIIGAGCISIAVKRMSQFNLKRMSEKSTVVTAYRDNKWKKLQSESLVPGDVVKLHSGDYVCVDAVLTNGRCVVNESSLTGEPTPVPKMSLSATNDVYGEKAEDMKYTLYCGTVIESVSSDGRDCAWCVVTATGVNTKQGQLVRSMLFPPKIRFKFDDHFLFVSLMMIPYAIFIFTIIFWLMNFELYGLFIGFYTLSNAFSPLIPAMFASGQAKCSKILKTKNIYCMELERTFIAGKLKMFCFDKTGTLTKQGMEYYGYCSVASDGNSFERLICDVTKINEKDRTLMGTCHEVDVEKNDANEEKIVGNEVDVAMFEASMFECVNGRSDRVKDSITKREYKILKRFEFSRETMMMSVIVEDMTTHDRMIYVKGSYEKVASHSISGVPPSFHKDTTSFARNGYYVLGVGHRVLSNESLESAVRDDFEKDLNFDGLLLFKNEIKSCSKENLEELKRGDISSVMITGDNIHTGCAVAIACNISDGCSVICGERDKGSNEVVWTEFESGNRVCIYEKYVEAKNRGGIAFAVTGKAFDHLLDEISDRLIDLTDSGNKMDVMRILLPYTKVFARMKPEQKVEVVKLQMEHNITGMCGDGANDAAALRVAHCGIALAMGNGSATIVAPFSTEETSLKVVVEVVREGRCALASAFAGYKRLMVSGQIMLWMKLVLYHFSMQFSEVGWIYLDGLVTVGMAFLMLESKAADRLTPTRPTSALLGLSVVTSSVVHTLLAIAFMIGAEGVLYYQDWFQCKNFDNSIANLAQWWTAGDNYESAVLFLTGGVAFVNLGFIFNFGFEYRQHWFKNYYLLAFWALVLGLTYGVMFAPGNWLSCFFRINCGDHSLMSYWSDVLSILGYNSETRLSVVPPGCSCDEQLVPSTTEGFTCEAEYISCEADHYNQVFHHNIFPVNFRFILLGITIAHFVISLFFEWFIMFGPVRYWMRKWKISNQMKKSNVHLVVKE